MKLRSTASFFLSVLLSLSLLGCTAGSGSKSENATNSAGLGFPISNATGGNGDHYGGKPEPGRYVRMVPDLNCPSKILAEVIVTETSATTKRTSTTDCTTTEKQVALTSLVHSQYATGRVALMAGVYKLENPTDAVDEAWCRTPGSTAQVGFDVVYTANYKTGVTIAHVVSSTVDQNGKLIKRDHGQTKVSREVDLEERIRYRSSDGNLRIDISTLSFNSVTGLMTGDFRFRRDGLEEDLNLECRLGGELDIRMNERLFKLPTGFEAADPN